MASSEVTVVRDGAVWTGGDDPRLFGRSDVVVEDGAVAEIVPRYRGPVTTEIDASGALVLPGLINAHVHAGCSPPIRGVAEDHVLPKDGAFYHNVTDLLLLAYRELEGHELKDILKWDVCSMLLGGATTIVEESFGGWEYWPGIVEEFGFRSSVGVTYPSSIPAIGRAQNGVVVFEPEPDVEARFEEALKAFDEHHATIGGRLRGHLSPHAADTVPEAVLRATATEAEARDTTVHLHVAQSRAEVMAIEARHNCTPHEFLDRVGLLTSRMLGTHSTFMTSSDQRRLAAAKASVVHCAYRKGKEGLTSPYADVLQGGAEVLLATDSMSHDFISELRFVSILAKIRASSPAALGIERLLASATSSAARTLRWNDIGRLEPGCRGDVVVVDISSPFNSPAVNPLSALVYYSTAGDLRHSLVDGKSVVLDGRLVGVDLEAVRLAATAACTRLWNVARDTGLLPQPSQPR